MLIPDTLPDSPLALLESWLDEAQRTARRPNANAMVLATVDAHGHPAARVVLCKEFVPEPGYAVFYTNYRSAKADQLAGVPRAAGVFHWDVLGRQVRLEGTVTRSPDAESDAYFESRDWESRIGAWASDQSQPIESATVLDQKMDAARAKFSAPGSGQEDASNVPRPPHWGGYRLWISAVEFWTHGEARLHDRARWDRRLSVGEDSAIESSPWHGSRLQP